MIEYRHGMAVLSVQSKSKLAQLTKTAMNIMGREEDDPSKQFMGSHVLRGAQRILDHPSHVRHSEYELLPAEYCFNN